jgi:hypothetical protein
VYLGQCNRKKCCADLVWKRYRHSVVALWLLVVVAGAMLALTPFLKPHHHGPAKTA